MTDMFLHQRNSGQGKPSRNFLFKINRAKRNDFILIFLLLMLSAVFGFFCWMNASDGNLIIVTVNGEAVGSYPLNRDDVVEIRTEYGENVLVIENGKAFMRSADCPNGICCAHKPIFRDGEAIVCYPHKLVVMVCAE